MADTSPGEKFRGSVTELSVADFDLSRNGGTSCCTQWASSRGDLGNDVGNILCSLSPSVWMALAGRCRLKGMYLQLRLRHAPLHLILENLHPSKFCCAPGGHIANCTLKIAKINSEKVAMIVIIDQKMEDDDNGGGSVMDNNVDNVTDHAMDNSADNVPDQAMENCADNGTDQPMEDDADNTVENNPGNAMDNTGPGENVNPNAGPTPGTSGLQAENRPPKAEEPGFDMSRVKLTYEAHPQYFPWKIRNDPVPQLIQNHGCSPSQTNSPSSSRISSSTGDYMESTDTEIRNYIRSPDENDGDDEVATSDEDEDQFSTLGAGGTGYRCEDSRDAFGDDENSEPDEPSNRRRRSRRSNSRFEGSGNDTSDGEGAGSENNENEGNEDNFENNGSDQDHGTRGYSNEINNEDGGNNPERQNPGVDTEMSFCENDDAQPAPEEEIEELETSDEEEDLESADVDLVTRIQRNLCRARAWCEPEIDQTATHISHLPLEMILYILRWVVTEDLDLRSLEMFSMVCRGFYICSRDSALWRAACSRVWGSANLQLVPYRNWRMMFLSRPRLNFNGCYVSRNTYVRHGEDSFRGQFYRPWHMVEYYRYLRFFPEGMVLMRTTTEPERSMLELFRNNNFSNPSYFVGYYIMQDDEVSLIFCRNNTVSTLRLREILSNMWNGILLDTYRMELQLFSLRYDCNGRLLRRPQDAEDKQGDSLMDVNAPIYPPFWFSRYPPLDDIPPRRPL